MEPKLAPIDAIWLFSVQTYPLPATSGLPITPTLHLYRSACGIGVARKNYLKWQAIQLAIHSTAGVYVDRLLIAVDRLLIAIELWQIYFSSRDTTLQIIKIGISKYL